MSESIKNKYEKLSFNIATLQKEMDEFFASYGKKYINQQSVLRYTAHVDVIYSAYQNTRSPFHFLRNKPLDKSIQHLGHTLSNLVQTRERSNQRLLESQVSKMNPLILRHGDKSLDEYQILPVMVDEHNVLVIAGAGTGKTSTILGKIKYLLLEKKVSPQNILVLTYTKTSSEDIIDRIKSVTGVEIDVSTFHKLGRQIITSVEGKVPTLTNIDLLKFVESAIQRLLNENVDYKRKLLNYLCFHQYLSKTAFDFKTEQEYNKYLELHPYITLNGEKVKSSEEVQIANFLLTNGIKYEYERKYDIDTADQEYGQYFPDFYLTESKIWIEHFAVDKDNNVPPFFKGNHGKSAKVTYLEGMEWKRKTHKENKTTLIETYSYEAFDGSVFKSLETKLKHLNVPFHKLSVDELFQKLAGNKKVLNGLVELFSTVINLAKSGNTSIDDFKLIKMTQESGFLRDLILPVYSLYEEELRKNKEIDFGDMLNKATKYISEGRYSSKYDYVIVDEFQDITNATYRFLKELRRVRDYKLLCVGDDWQSIYRFAGSNINYITSFENYFGPTETFRIRRTYRFSESIAQKSGSFIQRNPNQLKKDIECVSRRNSYDVGLIEAAGDNNCIEQLSQKLNELELNADILFIGRYRDDIEVFRNKPNYTFSFDPKLQATQVKYSKRTDLKITFRTAHQSKGLESDYVFIINNKEGLYGFPSQIQDQPIIEYFLGIKDSFPFSEERRLFYVALTRARKKVWLVANQYDKSSFIKELQHDYNNEFDRERYSCPKCGKKLIKKVGKFGPFLGCTNYPDCGFVRNLKGNTYPENVK